jgi:hypothetical protein
LALAACEVTEVTPFVPPKEQTQPLHHRFISQKAPLGAGLTFKQRRLETPEGTALNAATRLAALSSFSACAHRALGEDSRGEIAQMETLG